MAILYHHIEPDNFLDYGVTKEPRLPDDVSFIAGKEIRESLPDPLVFQVDFPTREEIPHFIAAVVPLFSDHLVATLKSGGVDNFQVFPAVLINPQVGVEWKGFWAFNAIGILAAANLKKSECDTLMEGDDEGVAVPLVAFETIVLDKKKTHNMLMFRLAESPSTLLIHDRINKHIDANRPPDGWRFDATEIETV